MKFKPELILIILLFSCVYGPPPKGKEISIHNQTNKPIVILDSLTQNHLRLYDTAIVNNRQYISRQPNYIAEYGIFQKFYSDIQINYLKNKKINKLLFYIIDTGDIESTFMQISGNHSFRSFSVNIDTLEKYDLNHLFVDTDTIYFEHDYSYYTKRQ